jgi:hypothetical protein
MNISGTLKMNLIPHSLCIEDYQYGTEVVHDKLGGQPHTNISANKFTAWTRLQTHFGFCGTFLLDDFTELSSKPYNWDNHYCDVNNLLI